MSDPDWTDTGSSAFDWHVEDAKQTERHIQQAPHRALLTIFYTETALQVSLDSGETFLTGRHIGDEYD